MGNNSLILMIIISFCLAAVVILKRDSIPERMRRPLALFSLFMVASSFVMLTILLFRL